MMLAWNRCPQLLHTKLPIPAFLSSLHVTASSWLQKRQLNVVWSGSFCSDWAPLGQCRAVEKAGPDSFHGPRRSVVRTFLGPMGLRDDFLRLPCVQTRRLELERDHRDGSCRQRDGHTIFGSCCATVQTQALHAVWDGDGVEAGTVEERLRVRLKVGL